MSRQEKNGYLSKREQQIVDLLVANGEMSASGIEELLPDAPTNSTVRSLLSIMVERGVAARVKRGRSFVYRLAKPRAAAAKEALVGVVQRFFEGSVSNAVNALVDTGGKLSYEEIDSLQQLIDASKEQSR